MDPSLLFTGAMAVIDLDKLPDSQPLRAQVAVVRAIAEEVQRRHPGEQCVPSLHGQLGEEMERLASLAPPSADEVEQSIDVLLVDDDEASRVAVARVVRSLGYPCRVVSDAEAALDEQAQSPAAIVLSDWSMPGKSGLELSVLLKSSADAPYFILATAFQDNDQKLARGSVDDYLLKPLAVEDLEMRLSAASRLIRAKRTLATRVK
jgi:CheY-like chemotaxis protein